MIKSFLHRVYRWWFDKKFRTDWGLCHPNIAWYTTTCPALARNVYWLFYPVAAILRSQNYLFSINNLSHSVGHAYTELDYAARLKKIQMSLSEKRLVVIWPRSPVANTFTASATCGEVKVIINGLMHLLIYPLLLRYKWLTFDASTSTLNHDLDPLKANVLSPAELELKYKNWYCAFGETKGFHPFRSMRKPGMPSELTHFIGSKPYILLQIKELAVNASFLPTDPLTYLPVIEQMTSKGYRIVFAGREKCPEIFKKYGILNYSESELASPENDYFLVRGANAVLSSASGFGMMADVMGKPLLAVNGWNFINFPSQTTLIIPSILSKNNRRLTFNAQLQLARKVGTCATALNRDDLYSCQDASSDDVYEAWQVILKRIETSSIELETELQLKFKDCLPNDAPIRHAISRVPDTFLKKNLDLLS